MELKEEDIDPINLILSELMDNKSVDGGVERLRKLNMGREDFDLYTQFIVNNGLAERPSFGNPRIEKNVQTARAIQDNAVRAIFDKQQEDKRRQKDIDIERRINIKNARWALPLSIIGAAIALLALLVSIIALCA